MNVAIAPDLEDFVRARIANDGFETAEQVVDFALRQLQPELEDDEAQTQRLLDALAEGEADIVAGRVVTIRSEEELRTLIRGR